MTERAASGQVTSSVAFLFSPHALPIIDLFRALGDFEEHYDVATLDALERRLSETMTRDVAKGLVSDALLLAFGLRRERSEALMFQPVQSRRGTLDEYRLIGLLGACFWHDFGLATQAAAALGLSNPRPLVSLAFEIARRLEAAGLRLEAPDPRLFSAQPAGSPVERMRPPAAPADLKLSFDF